MLSRTFAVSSTFSLLFVVLHLVSASNDQLRANDCMNPIEKLIFNPFLEWKCAYRNNPSAIPTVLEREECEKQIRDIQTDLEITMQKILRRTDIVSVFTENDNIIVGVCEKVWISGDDVLKNYQVDGKCPIHMAIIYGGKLRFVNTKTMRLEEKSEFVECEKILTSLIVDSESTNLKRSRRFLGSVVKKVKEGVVDVPKKVITSTIPKGIGSIVLKPFEFIFKLLKSFLQSLASIISNTFLFVVAVLCIGILLYCGCYLRNLSSVASIFCGFCCFCCPKKPTRKAGFTQVPMGFGGRR